MRFKPQFSHMPQQGERDAVRHFCAQRAPVDDSILKHDDFYDTEILLHAGQHTSPKNCIHQRYVPFPP
jgi:hypothetical protein